MPEPDTTGRVDEAGRTSRFDRADAGLAAGIGLLTIVTSLPFLLSGGGFFREDWKALADARWKGWSGAGDVVRARRPAGALLYDLVYTAVGDRARLAFAAVLAVNVVVGVLLYLVVRRFVDRWTAAAVAFVFVLLPSRAALVHWLNGIALEVALAILLAGVLMLERALDRRGNVWPAYAVLALSTVVYDPTVVAAMLVLVALPRIVLGRYRRDLVVGAVVLGVVRGIWSALTQSGTPAFIRPGDAFSSNFGWGVVDPRAGWIALQLVVLIGIVVAVVRWRNGTAAFDREGLVLAGLAVWAAGILPFAQTGNDVSFIGIGSRANFIAAIGAALVFVGLARMVPGPPAVWGTLVVALGLVCLPLRIRQDHDWEHSYTASRQLIAQAVVLARAGNARLTYGPNLVACGGVEGISGDASDELHVGLRADRGTLRFAPPSSPPPDVSTASLRC